MRTEGLVIPEVREATPDDNSKLLALTAACPSYGIYSRIDDRSPDFFAMNRLMGGRWSVGVVDAPDGSIAGCTAFAERMCYVHGVLRSITYGSDRRVHPTHRGTGIADSLSRYTRRRSGELSGRDAPRLGIVSVSNKAMQVRIP